MPQSHSPVFWRLLDLVELPVQLGTARFAAISLPGSNGAAREQGQGWGPPLSGQEQLKQHSLLQDSLRAVLCRRDEHGRCHCARAGHGQCPAQR